MTNNEYYHVTITYSVDDVLAIDPTITRYEAIEILKLFENNQEIISTLNTILADTLNIYDR